MNRCKLRNRKEEAEITKEYQTKLLNKHNIMFNTIKKEKLYPYLELNGNYNINNSKIL